MAWNGTGTFSRTNGTNSGATTWAQDEAGAVDIESARHDLHDQDLSDGINACLAKNGENAMTGDLALGGNNITGAAAVTGTGTGSFGSLSVTDRIRKVKTAGQSVTSSTTVADDDHLAGYSLDASSYYEIEGVLRVTSTSSTPDFKFALQVSSGLSSSIWGYHAVNEDGDTQSDSSASLVSTMAVDMDANKTYVIRIFGTILTSGATTVDLQWAQNVSNATATTMAIGSYLKIEKLA